MSLIEDRVVLLWLRKQADLSPPLGYPGGICHTVERVENHIVNPRLEELLVSKVEKGDLPNPDAAKVYTRKIVNGTWKFKFELSSHVQYRMDLRSITLPEIRAAISSYFKKMNQMRSKNDNSEWIRFDSGEKIVYEEKRLDNLIVVFSREGSNVFIQSCYRKGETDPKGKCFKF